jgi:hypothetical protein
MTCRRPIRSLSCRGHDLDHPAADRAQPRATRSDASQIDVVHAADLLGDVLLLPAGLVLYWITNNILSIAQQWMINTRMGVPPQFNLPKFK